MTPQDFDRLSAYIDNQLPAGERAALEARLAQDAELHATLDELRLTVRALRALPRVKPPRSFVLSPAQVGAASRARRGGLFPVLRLATALSALALAVTVAGDLLWGGSATAPQSDALLTGAAEQAAATAEDVQAEAEVAMAPVGTPTQTRESAVELFATTPPAVDNAAGGEAEEAETPMAAIAAPAEATPTDTALRAFEPTPSVKAPTATETPAPPGDAPPGGTELAYAEAGGDGSGAAGGAGGAGGAIQTTTQAPGPQLPTVRLLQAGLAMLTVLLGLGSWLARRNA